MNASGFGAIIFAVLFLLPMVIGYLWVSLATVAVFKKTGSPAWQAWVPVVREWEMFRLAGMNPIWALVLVGGGILVAVLFTITNAVTLLNGSTPNALLLLGTGLLGLAFSVFAIVIIIRFALRFNAGFGLGSGFAVLAVLVWPIWLSVLGWGGARWQGAAAPAPLPGPPMPPPSPFQMQQPGAPVQQPGVPSGVVYESPVPTPQFTGAYDQTLPPAPPAPPAQPAPAGAPGPQQFAPAPPAPPAPIEPHPVAPQQASPQQPVPQQPAPAAPSVWAPPPAPGVPVAPAAPAATPAPPPPAAPPAPVAPAPVTPAPAAPAPVPPAPGAPVASEPVVPEAAPAPAQPIPSEEFEEFAEHTVLATRSKHRAVLVLPGGEETVLTESAVIIGRAPDAPADRPETQLIAVDEPTRTISKTHAMLERSGATWTIRDLGSTNGVALIHGAGTEHEVTETVPLTGAFLLGDAKFELRV